MDRTRSSEKGSWVKQDRVYLVMPPGHGKSVLHTPEIGLLESDHVVGPRSNPELSALRDVAKTTGDWTAYDTCWGRMLAANLPRRAMVMVQSRQIGEAAGLAYAGSCYLALPQWIENLSGRTGNPDKYHACWEAAKRDGVEMKTNDDTTQWVKEKYNVWNTYGVHGVDLTSEE